MSHGENSASLFLSVTPGGSVKQTIPAQHKSPIGGIIADFWKKMHAGHLSCRGQPEDISVGFGEGVCGDRSIDVAIHTQHQRHAGLRAVGSIKSDQPCEVSYKDRQGKYMGQKGVTLPKVIQNSIRAERRVL